MEVALLVAAGVGALVTIAVTALSRRRARLSAAAINRIILRRLHLALDAADAGAWEWRLGLPSLRASGFARLLGADSDDEVTVSTWESAIHPDDRDRWWSSVNEAVAQGAPWACLHRIVMPDGSIRWLDARAEPIRTTDGSVDGLLGICVDVTERHERQQRDRRAAQIAQAVAETGAALTALSDEELIWAEAVDAAVRIFSCTQARVLPPDHAVAATWTDPASGIAAVTELRGMPGMAGIVVPIDLAGEQEAQLALIWEGPQPDLDRAWIASLDRFAANIALALVIARRQQASGERDVLARRLQAGLMPTAGSDAGPLRVEMIYQPGEDRLMLGGDFLDVVRHPDGRVSFIIGDVCGHGPAEAALGTILRSAWTGIASTAEQDPATWLAVLDGILLARREQAHTFVTAVAGILDPAGSMTYAVAGHPPPLLITDVADPDLRSVQALDEGAGPALGLRSTIRPRTSSAPLPHGCAVLVVTDGLFEGVSSTGARLGYADFVDVIAAIPLAPDTHALRRLVSSVSALNGGALDDDAAALLITNR